MPPSFGALKCIDSASEPCHGTGPASHAVREQSPEKVISLTMHMLYNEYSDSQDTCPSCVHFASDMFIVENTRLYTRFQDSCSSVFVCSWFVRVMKYSWPYNFVLCALCDVEPVKGFGISGIDVSVSKIYETVN